ncbi:MAG TPA: glycosyltransferase, partial [Pyrinomonadaceae bacterium]
PPLEAMQCGVPVIAGNRTSLPEVVGDAGLLVDPFDIKALAEAIGDLIGNSDFRDKLRAKGLARARKFDWQETARRTLDVYKEVVGTAARSKAFEQRAGRQRSAF